MTFWNHLRTSFKSVPISAGPSNWYIWVALAHGLIRAKLMYRSGVDTVNNILLSNILIYLFSSRNSPNLVTDLSNGYVLSLTSWFCILEMLISIYRKWKLDVAKESSCASVTNKFHSGKLCSAGPPNKTFPVRRWQVLISHVEQR